MIHPSRHFQTLPGTLLDLRDTEMTRRPLIMIKRGGVKGQISRGRGEGVRK